MKVHVLKTIHVDTLGRLTKGAIVEMNDRVANVYLTQNAVERYETKVVREEPFQRSGIEQAQTVAEKKTKMTAKKR